MMTRVFKAAQTLPAFSALQGKYQKQSGENARFLGRVWCGLSVHLGPLNQLLCPVNGLIIVRGRWRISR